MANVYFKAVSGGADVSAAGRAVLKALLDAEKVVLEKNLPLKLHFGEKGNRTYLPQSTYEGIIDELESRGSVCRYTETSVLYGGERFSREKHLRLAQAHGFDRLPIVIADGAHGEESVNVPVGKKHFRSAAIAKDLAEAPQVIVLAHFKGHALAGFGGAIKQLSMGFAAKGGKMAMHMGVKPRIRSWLCRHCGLCASRCHESAITIGKTKHDRSFIDPNKCVGCGACFSACPHHAVSILSLRGFWNALFRGKFFREKLVEYAYASHTGKRNVYITFALNVTRGCDCEPRSMSKCIPDIGVFASLDPVAIDTACWDAASKAGKAFRGREQLDYAQKIGLGTKEYTLIPL